MYLRLAQVNCVSAEGPRDADEASECSRKQQQALRKSKDTCTSITWTALNWENLALSSSVNVKVCTVLAVIF